MEGLAAAMATIHAVRRQLFPGRHSYSHVTGHSGVAPNEIVGILSKLAAAEDVRSCGLQQVDSMLSFWCDTDATRLAWVPTVLRSSSGDPCLPPLQGAALGHDYYHAGLEPAQILEPFVPAQVPLPEQRPDASAGDHIPVRLHLRLTFNVLSLLDKVEGTESQEAGLGMQPGRVSILAQQLAAADVHIAFLQETRCQAGTYRAGSFVRFVAGASRGQWGNEIWLRDGFSFATREGTRAPMRLCTASHSTRLMSSMLTPGGSSCASAVVLFGLSLSRSMGRIEQSRAATLMHGGLRHKNSSGVSAVVTLLWSPVT